MEILIVIALSFLAAGMFLAIAILIVKLLEWKYTR